MTAPYWLDPDLKTDFPDIDLALQEPDGLLAVGGDLSIERLYTAYKSGIFPWYSEGQPILWWSPDPRMVLYPDEIKISRSLLKKIRKKNFKITFDQDFSAVINACAEPRIKQQGTWILAEMRAAYSRLQKAGIAHSVECWLDDQLVGGLYGVAIGNVYFGESMFSRVSDASKIAFVYLASQLKRWKFTIIDCQVYSTHLESLGAKLIPRKQFKSLLDKNNMNSAETFTWCFDSDLTEFIISSGGS
jgi:leucyl/phenylalanyl-tRNA--protein transferase